MDFASKDKVLYYFKTGRNMPVLETEEEKKLFLQLQRYNLIEVNPEGKLTITKRGNDALSCGVDKYLSLERYEKRLITDGLRGKKAEGWIVVISIGIVILVLIFTVIQLF